MGRFVSFLIETFLMQIINKADKHIDLNWVQMPGPRHAQNWDRGCKFKSANWQVE